MFYGDKFDGEIAGRAQMVKVQRPGVGSFVSIKIIILVYSAFISYTRDYEKLHVNFYLNILNI